MNTDAVADLLDSESVADPLVRALLSEAALFNEYLSPIRNRFNCKEIKPLVDHTPLIYLASALLADDQDDPGGQWLFSHLRGHYPQGPENTGRSGAGAGFRNDGRLRPDLSNQPAFVQ